MNPFPKNVTKFPKTYDKLYICLEGDLVSRKCDSVSWKCEMKPGHIFRRPGHVFNPPHLIHTYSCGCICKFYLYMQFFVCPNLISKCTWFSFQNAFMRPSKSYIRGNSIIHANPFCPELKNFVFQYLLAHFKAHELITTIDLVTKINSSLTGWCLPRFKEMLIFFLLEKIMHAHQIFVLFFCFFCINSYLESNTDCALNWCSNKLTLSFGGIWFFLFCF